MAMLPLTKMAVAFWGWGRRLEITLVCKTFDVQAIDRELRPNLLAKRPSPDGDIYGVTYFTEHEPNGKFYYTKGPVPIAKIFEQFRVAYRRKHKAGVPQSSGGIENAWREHPPTPVSNPWDAELENSGGHIRGHIRGTQY